MKKRNISLQSSLGGDSKLTAKLFFINNHDNGIANVNGIVDASVFLDYVEALSANGKRRYEYLWQLMRANHLINGMLVARTDEKNVNYVWVEFELPRGKAPFKVVLLSDKMFDFIVKYQKAEVSIRFTLQELIDEAVRIESTQTQSHVG